MIAKLDQSIYRTNIW